MVKTPTARQRRLAGELRSLREAAGLSRDDVQERIGLNPVTLYRIERARSTPQQRTLQALLDLYTPSAEKAAGLRELLRTPGRQAWVVPQDLPADLGVLVGFEAEAAAVWSYGLGIVPGLLQTEEYARALIAGMLPTAGAADVSRRVETRMRRQEALGVLELDAVIDEAALRRPCGRPETMRAQVAHLRASLDRDEVTLRVLPLAHGPHPALLAPFDILRFAESGSADIVYLEGLAQDVFVDDEQSTRQYREVFEDLRTRALDAAGTKTFLDRLINEI